jgi:hypothetical protein
LSGRLAAVKVLWDMLQSAPGVSAEEPPPENAEPAPAPEPARKSESESESVADEQEKDPAPLKDKGKGAHRLSDPPTISVVHGSTDESV